METKQIDEIEEESVPNDVVFNDIMAGVQDATLYVQARNLKAFVSESADWIGRAPSNDDEKKRVRTLRERAVALTAIG